MLNVNYYISEYFVNDTFDFKEAEHDSVLLETMPKDLRPLELAPAIRDTLLEQMSLTQLDAFAPAKEYPRLLASSLYVQNAQNHLLL